MTTQNKWIIGIVALVIIVGGILLFSNDDQQISDKPIRIGVSTLLTEGVFAQLGQNIVNTAMLAVEEINARGGINGRTIELVVENAGLDSKDGLAAAQKLINAQGIKYIIGGTSSNGTLASAPVANAGKVIYMTPVTGGSNVDNAGEYIFRTANADVLAGVAIAESMFELGIRKAAAVAEVTEYTLDVSNSFTETFEELGGEVVFEERFQPGTTDLRTIVSKVKAVQPEAILIASQTGISGAHFLNQAREQSLDALIFSDFTFVANGDALQIVGSFEGIYFADPAYDIDNPELQAFFATYEARFGNQPVIPFHAAATYDAVQMITQAIDAVGDDSEKVRDWLLENVKNWQGFMGTYSLDEKGNSDLGFVMKVVRNGEFVLLNN